MECCWAGGVWLRASHSKNPYALLLDSLDETVTELWGSGVEGCDPKPVGSSRQAFVSDPAGNLIELHEAG